MKRKAVKTEQNFLEFIPKRSEHLTWKTDQKGIVTLDVKNTGLMNKIMQKVFLKPEVTHIHLDEVGSFVWPLIDGKKTIVELSKDVDAAFGDKASPLYERLAKFFQILESYHFIELKKD